jgi:putative transposase
MIKANEGDFSVSMMCRMVNVSRSGYYGWKRHSPSKRSQANKVLSENIKRVFDDENARAGSPRITLILQREGLSASHNRVAKIMRENGWRAKAAKKYKATTNSNHSLPVAPNLLEQNFEADVPDQKWVSEISPIFGQKKAGCIWPSCLNCTRVGWWAGQWLNT